MYPACTNIWVRDLGNYRYPVEKIGECITQYGKKDPRTGAQGWQHVSTQMEHESDIHKEHTLLIAGNEKQTKYKYSTNIPQKFLFSIMGALNKAGAIPQNLAVALEEELVKVLKSVIDVQHKTRKQIELTIDKATRILHDRRTDEVKSKKACHSCAKDNERVQEQMVDVKGGKSKMLSEKDFSKLESKRRKAEEATKRADTDYYSCSVRAERAREEWECAVFRSCGVFQEMEQERLLNMSTVLTKHSHHISVIGPRMVQLGERLASGAERVDVPSDIQTIIAMRGTGPNIPEQILPDFYAEEMVNTMNSDRRREVLEKLLLVIKHDIEREKKAKQGLEHLAAAFAETPNFTDDVAQSDVHDKLINMKSMIRFFEAARYKITCSLCELENKPKPSHVLSRYLYQNKDRQGFTHSILRGPPGGFNAVRSLNRRNSNDSNSSSGCGSDFTDFSSDDREAGDGNSLEHDTFYEEQFQDFTYSGAGSGKCSTTASEAGSSTISHNYQQPNSDGATTSILGRCRVLYNYEANLNDELTIHPDDIINIYCKQDDNWWQGELNGVFGIFPATYVEDLK
ncbi:Nostrin [Nymphon striatum]|nr:Nostrin [Nymphon striatum]